MVTMMTKDDSNENHGGDATVDTMSTSIVLIIIMSIITITRLNAFTRSCLGNATAIQITAL